jgi:hypothetical protein
VITLESSAGALISFVRMHVQMHVMNDECWNHLVCTGPQKRFIGFIGAGWGHPGTIRLKWDRPNPVQCCAVDYGRSYSDLTADTEGFYVEGSFNSRRRYG